MHDAHGSSWYGTLALLALYSFSNLPMKRFAPTTRSGVTARLANTIGQKTMKTASQSTFLSHVTHGQHQKQNQRSTTSNFVAGARRLPYNSRRSLSPSMRAWMADTLSLGVRLVRAKLGMLSSSRLSTCHGTRLLVSRQGFINCWLSGP